MKILITGGAGYIGSHVVRQLGERGADTLVVLDDLSTGHREAVLYGEVRRVDLADERGVSAVLREGCFDAVIHMAASVQVAESLRHPERYFANNADNTARLLRLAREAGVRRFVYSSTAAVYGIPSAARVAESHALAPINPYGRSKLLGEDYVRAASRADPEFRHVVLRYFNAAGADPHGRTGSRAEHATHLIHVAGEAAAGRRPRVEIFGTDYDTPDGTCVRDYVHVEDLADAHHAALQWLERERTGTFNLGYGRGASVREVIGAVKKVSGVDFPVFEAPRRPGDPPHVVAEVERARDQLGWRPRYDDLETICRSAWNWQQKLA